MAYPQETRTLDLKEKRHRKRYRKNGKKMVRRKHSLSPQEDEGLEKLAVEEMRSGYNVQDCLMDAEGIGKVQVKIIYSGKEEYLYDSLSILLSCCSDLSTAALFGRVSRLLELMDRPITPLKPETGILVSHRRLLSSSPLLLVVGGMLCKGTNHVRPFFSWLQACSKDLAHSRGQDIINAGLDLYCSFIKLIAGHTSHLYGIKGFKPKKLNRLTFSGSENQDGQSMQKFLECERFKDPYLETGISKQECAQITDCTKSHMERRPKRHRRIYKLAPAFQHPRILSETQRSTWKNKSANGASNLYAETDAAVAMQNPDNHVRKLVTGERKDDLTGRDASCRAKDASVCKVGVCEVDPYPVTSKCSDSRENPVIRSSSVFHPGTQPCAGLCLPEQFARQLVELFGCPGIELDASEPKDFIVPLDLARRIYLKWKKSLEAKYKLLPAK